MKTLYLAWQSAAPQKAWFPIGRLDADQSKGMYTFVYTQGAAIANKEAGLLPLDSFPDFYQQYSAHELFPLFSNRVLGSGREDFAEYLRQLDLTPEHADPIEILAVTGGERQTDNLEVFPKFTRKQDGSFLCRFFLHGWRHINEEAQNRLRTLQAGDELRIAVELNNPATTLALQLETPDDYFMVGWTPRYLVNDLIEVMKHPTKISAKIVKINPAPAPSKLRVLIELTGVWPKNYIPMSTSAFEPLHHRKMLLSKLRSA